ncbi:MAG: MMPL family transporter [Candidatus Methylomirabilales bacterium]
MILRHPRVVLLLTSLLAFASLLAAMQWLEIHPSRSELIFTGKRLLTLKQAYKREFPDRDSIVVVVDASDLGRAKQFVSALATRLQKDPDHITELFYRVDDAPFEAHGLQYLSRDELQTLRQKIEDHRVLIQELTAAPGLNTLFTGINREMGQAVVGHLFTGFLEEEKAKSGQVDLTFLNALLRQVNDGLRGLHTTASPWAEWLGAGKEPVSGGYLLTEDKRYLLLLARARGTGGRTLVPKRESIRRIRTAIAELRQVYPGIEAGVTGSDALASDEIVTAKRDATRATILSLVGVSILFLLFWRSLLTPLRALISLAMGVAWTLGFITLTVGSLNILSAMFIPILIGLGIDYNIHLLERYEEERAAGRDAADALENTFHRAVTIVTGAITTVVAFYSLLLTNFKGLVELGFITGSGLLLCLGATLTVLPALLVVSEQTEGARFGSRPASFLGVLERWSHHPRIMIAGAGVLAVAALPALGKIRIEFNLLELQAQGTESVQWERRLLADGGTSTWYGIGLARSAKEVQTKKASLEALPSVDRVQTVFSFLPKNAASKLRIIRALRAPLHGLAPRFGRLEPVDVKALQATLGRMRFKLGDKERFSSASDRELEEARRLLDAIKARLKKGDAAQWRRSLGTIQAGLFADFEKKITVLRKNLKARPMTVADLPRQLRDRFVGTKGTYLLKVFPQGNSWGREGVQRFVRDVHSVDPDIIGDPVTAWEDGHNMERGYLLGGLYAAAAMVVVILWSFGSLGHLLLAVLPLVVGGAWTLGLMELFKINFNLANLILLPLIAGYGIMNGLHIVKRCLQEEGKGSIIANSTGRAVFLSASTTMVGFGSLMVASHRGIFSLGFLLSVGVGSILLASLTVLPAFLWVLYGARKVEPVGEAPHAGRYAQGSWQLPHGERDHERPLERRPLR